MHWRAPVRCWVEDPIASAVHGNILERGKAVDDKADTNEVPILPCGIRHKAQ